MDAEHRTLPTCYRHPDRETRLGCSSCGRSACVECLRPAEVGQKCPECAQPAAGTRVLTAADLDTGGRRAPFTFAILGVCLVVFALGFLSPEVGNLLYGTGAQVNALIAQGEWWRLLTAGFLHASLMHVGFNMWALYLFGPPLEREVGTGPFAALYLASLLAGSAAFFLVGSPSPAVGASGAVFGLFGAWLAASLRNRHTAAGQAGLRQLLVLLGINLALPLIVPNIAWEAHMGGLVAGFAIVLVWGSLARVGEARAAVLRTLVAVAVGALAVVSVLSAVL